MKDFSARIESAIQARAHDEAHRLIQSYLLSEKRSPEARLAASEYYRRLADYSKALRVLNRAPRSGPREAIGEAEVEIELQTVRILNLLGGSSYALQIIEKLPRAWRKKYGFRIAPVLMANYRYEEALAVLDPLSGVQDSELDYSKRLQLLALSDCYCGLGRYDEARSVADRVLALTREPLLQAIAHEAYGSYCILGGRVEDAGAALLKSEKLFDEHDRTPDHGFLLKWLGAYHCLQGKFDLADGYLSRAWEVLYRPGFKPEAWLDVLYWVGLVKLRRGKARAAPAEWLRVLCFPTPGNPISDRMKKEIELPDVIVLSAAEAPARTGPARIDLRSGVKTVLESGSARHELGLSVADRLHALLILCGPYGVPQFRAYERLWPDSILAFDQHQKRLEQAVMALRHEKIEVYWSDFHLRIGAGNGVTCLWSSAPSVEGLVFLESVDEFRREEVERFFSISKRSANEILRNWEARGFAVAEGKGPSRRYRSRVKAEGST